VCIDVIFVGKTGGALAAIGFGRWTRGSLLAKFRTLQVCAKKLNAIVIEGASSVVEIDLGLFVAIRQKI
jgi:hypothetical protein